MTFQKGHVPANKKRPDTPKAAEAAVQEAVQEVRETAAANSAARQASIEEQLAALPSYLKEAIIAQAEANAPSLSAEDAALRRRLADAEIQGEGTEFGAYEANASLEDRYRSARRPTPGVDSLRDRRDPTVDKYSPCKTTADWESQEAVKRFNHVGPGRMVITVGRPEIYKDDLNRVDEICYDIEDAHVVTRKSDGKPLYSRDAVFISIPKAYGDAMRRVEREEREQWDREIKAGTQHGSIIPRSAPPELVHSHQQAVAEAARERSRQLSIGSQYHSPTGGHDLATAERMFSNAEILDMEARARSGNRHHSYDEIKERVEAGKKGKQTFGGLTGAADKWTRSSDAKREAARAK